MKKKIMMIAAFVLVMIGFYALYRFNYIPHRKSQMRDNMINVRGSRRPKGFRGFSVEII